MAQQPRLRISNSTVHSYDVGLYRMVVTGKKGEEDYTETLTKAGRVTVPARHKGGKMGLSEPVDQSAVRDTKKHRPAVKVLFDDGTLSTAAV